MIKNKHGILEMTEMNYDKNRNKATNPIKIQDVTFRDGHQSIFATRGRTEDMIEVASQMDEIGFYSMEVWGGATFDTMHRYLNEDPWERITTLKKYIKKTPLSMLLRGQNLVGYRNYADDVVEAFVDTACNKGIDIFRVFDALNDFRNFETAVKVIKKNEKHFQGTICYSLTEKRMGGDIYNLDYYLKKAKELVEMGANSICIKDMAGLISPYDAYNLIVALKETYNTPIHLHTHFTSGMGDLTLLKAVEAGVDIIDTCMSPYAYRTSHPAIEPFVISLLGTNRDTGFDIEALAKIDEKIEKSAVKYMDYLDKTKLSIIDTNVILHQTPGGMLSNLVNQLKMMNSLDKLPKVFETLPKVRKDLGSVPLVTPTSQIVGIQTVNNVLFDSSEESYSKITEQVKDLCFGLYGHTTRPIDPEVQKKALNGYPRGQEPITSRPGDIIKPELPAIEEKFGDLAKSKEDLLICALYPVTGKRFLQWKYGQTEIPDEVKPKSYEDVEREKKLIEDVLTGKVEVIPKKNAPAKPENLKNYTVYVDGEYFKVEIADDGIPNVVSAQPSQTPQKTSPAKAKKTAPVIQEGDNPVVAPIPGMISEYKKKIGDEIKAGETIVVLEAMKMFNNLDSPCDGIVKSINYSEGDSVAKDDVLCIIEKK